VLVYTIRRILWIIPVILIISTVVFFGIHIAPGDPATIMLGLYAGQEALQQIRHELGLDKPLLTQYGHFLGGLVKGDLGISLHKKLPVLKLVFTAFYPTFQLVVVSMGLSLLFGVLLGTIAAVFENSILDSVSRILAVVGVSAPTFWIGLLLIIVFAVQLKWLPVAGYGSWKHLVMPALALTGSGLAYIARLLRSNLLDQKRQDYVRTARSKGISEKRVWAHHIFRNSLVSVVTMVGVRFGTLLGGAVIVETVFAWPGLGTLIINATYARDYPVLLGAVIWTAIVITFVNLVVDLIYAVLDPRIVYD
jgi:ABC-type dipeptide/oligopeptide/nickel transport system permease component